MNNLTSISRPYSTWHPSTAVYRWLPKDRGEFRTLPELRGGKPHLCCMRQDAACTLISSAPPRRRTRAPRRAVPCRAFLSTSKRATILHFGWMDGYASATKHSYSSMFTVNNSRRAGAWFAIQARAFNGDRAKEGSAPWQQSRLQGTPHPRCALSRGCFTRPVLRTCVPACSGLPPMQL